MSYDCFKHGVQIFEVTMMLVYRLRKCAHRDIQHISFESTQKKHQHGTKITSTEVKKAMVIKKIITITILSGFYTQFTLF